ncbi:MAG: hypothetical protein JJW00_02530 [Sulfurimonas sp.]|nr:hypothetical protein [Sulfurimonas sp.]
MSLVKNLSLLLVATFIVGCGGGEVEVPSHLKNDFHDSLSVNFDADPKLNFYEQNDIRYSKYVDHNLKLSEGLLTPYFTKLMDRVLQNEELRNRKNRLLVAVDFKGYSAKQGDLLKEIKLFIHDTKHLKYKHSNEEISSLVKDQKEHRENGFTGQISNITPQEADLILKVNFKGNEKFEIKLIPVRGAIIYFDETVDLRSVANELQSNWAEVKVPDNMGNIDTYMIMKGSVTQAMYKSEGSENKAMTNIGYAKAKNYCQSINDGASLSSVYVFEYARRDGVISKPFSPGHEEMIEGYSSEFDDKYCSEADTLSLRQKKYSKNCRTAVEIDDMAEDDDSVEISGNEIILFDWANYQYWGASKSHTGANVTFRCMKQK